MTEPSTFPTVATRIKLDTGYLEATKSPTKTDSDCIGRMVAAMRAEKKRLVYAIMCSSLPENSLYGYHHFAGRFPVFQQGEGFVGLR